MRHSVTTKLSGKREHDDWQGPIIFHRHPKITAFSQGNCKLRCNKPPNREWAKYVEKCAACATASKNLCTRRGARIIKFTSHSLDLLLKNINQLAYKSASRNSCGNGTNFTLKRYNSLYLYPRCSFHFSHTLLNGDV
jgi:hypothetical protein